MIEQASLVIGEGNWAVKSDSLLGYKINGGKYYPREMSVTRATTATRVNSAGLVELVPYNLLTYSQEFDNAAWTQTNGNGGSTPIVTANYGISPDGTQNAYRIQLTRTSVYGSYSWVYQQFTATIGQPYTWSVWLKSLSGTPSVALTNDGASFANIVTLTNEWERYEFTTNAIATPCNAMFLLYELIPSTSLTADFLAYGFQAVEGSTALPYQKTETRLNIPRLDYSNGTCPSLLVEPQRTNLQIYSEDFRNIAEGGASNTWTPNDTLILSTNNTAPDGTLTATRIRGNGSNRARQAFIFGTMGSPYSGSIFIRRVSGSSNIELRVGDVSQVAIINPTSSWQRFTYTASPTSTVIRLAVVFSNNTDEFEIWGAQLEAGAYPTSYIPTTSASVTRNADAISKTGISSLIGQTEGTIFWDIYVDIPSATGHEDIFNIDNGSFGNTIYLAKLSNAAFACEMYVSNVQQATFTKTGITAGRHKIAFAYANNNTAMFFDGVQVGSTDTSCSVPTMSRIQLGQGVLGPSTGFTNAAALWQTRLDNATLASLTTL